jgi:hypothetical protein
MDKDRDLFEDYEEGMEQMDPTPTGEGGPHEVVRVPWWWNEARGWKHAVKTLGKIALGVGVAVAIWMFLGPWSFLGLVPVVIWIPFLQSKLKEDDIVLWEFRIPDQKIDIGNETIKTKDRQIRPWYIPRDLWPHHTHTGTPFTISEGVYICQYYDPVKGIIAYSDRPATSNMVRYIDGLWNWIVETLPLLETRLYLYRRNNKMMANRRAIEILDRLHHDRGLIQGQRIRQKTIAKQGGGPNE